MPESRALTMPDGSWIDVTPLPSDSVAVAVVRPSRVEVSRRTAGTLVEILWTVEVPVGIAPLGFLRCAADGQGHVAIIGQGQDGGCYVSREGRALEYLGATFGVFCVEIAGFYEGGWLLAVLRPGYYELLTLPLEGPPVGMEQVLTDTTQGFIQIDGGNVVLSDVGRKAVPGLILAEKAGPYAVGQNPDAGPDRVRLTDGNNRYAALVADYAQPPHLVEASDGTLWACSWLAAGAWVASYTPDAIPWGNEASPPVPPISPEPELDPPMATIRSYSPSDGDAPLSVRAVAEIDEESGPITNLEWRYRAQGGGVWTLGALNPPSDLDHTYVFAQPGTYELSLRATGPGGTDETGKLRLVTVRETVTPEPPEPVPQPPTKPPVLVEGEPVSLKCWDQTHYWCAEEGGGVEGDGRGRATATRTEVGGWESFQTRIAPDGRIGFQARDSGAWLCADDLGDLWFNRQREADYMPGAWEAFTVEAGLGGGTSLKTDHGTYVQAVGGGGSELIHRARVPEHSEAAETFYPSRPLIPLVVLPGVPVSGEVYAGGLRQHGNEYYQDATGPVLPLICHYGDGLSKYVRDPGHVRANLDRMRAKGYGGVRTWSALGGSYWAGREIGPMHQGDGYWQAVRSFCDELKARGMGWFLTQGDCYPETIGSDPHGFFRRLGETVRDYVPQIALFEVANESRDTCPNWTAADCAEMASAFHGACPEVTIRLLSAYTGHEEVNITDDYSRDPATAFTVHGYRGGHWWDKVRHIFSFVYEQKPKRRLGWQGEPSGPGSAVSVTENQHELVDGPLMAMAAMSLMTRQGWVYFCGPGVKSDEGETFEQMAGFATVPSVVGMLPKDVMAWTGGLFHGGDTWASQRMFAPHGETRCDHVVSNDGRVVCLIYGEHLDYEQVRGTIDVEHDLAGAAKLVIGHY